MPGNVPEPLLFLLNHLLCKLLHDYKMANATPAITSVSIRGKKRKEEDFF